MSYQASPWDWVVFVALEVQCGLFLFLSVFGLPISDWLRARRLRKDQQWKYRHRQSVPKTERVGGSRWHRRN